MITGLRVSEKLTGRSSVSSPLLERAELLLAIGFPDQASALFHQVKPVEHGSCRYRALQLRLMITEKQWQQGMNFADRVNLSDSHRLRKAAGRFLLAFARNQLAAENFTFAEQLIVRVRTLWPEGIMDYLTLGMGHRMVIVGTEPDVPFDLSRPELRRVNHHEGDVSHRQRQMQTRVLKWHTSRPSHASQTRLPILDFRGAIPLIQCKLGWLRLDHARVRHRLVSWLPSVSISRIAEAVKTLLYSKAEQVGGYKSPPVHRGENPMSLSSWKHP